MMCVSLMECRHYVFGHSGGILISLECTRGAAGKPVRKSREWDGGQDCETHCLAKLHCVIFNDGDRVGDSCPVTCVRVRVWNLCRDDRVDSYYPSVVSSALKCLISC